MDSGRNVLDQRMGYAPITAWRQRLQRDLLEFLDIPYSGPKSGSLYDIAMAALTQERPSPQRRTEIPGILSMNR